jgi:ERCC4-type nuclease
MIQKCPELGFMADTYFTDELCIERKANLSELAGNLSNQKDDGRIYKEFNRMINIERVYLLIEDDCFDDIYAKKYVSDYNPDSFVRTLLTWEARNNMKIRFIKKENMARTIYELCKNCLDSKILKGSV